MDEAAAHRLLAQVANGSLPVDEALAVLTRLPYADIEFARVDHHRMLRQGIGEAVYAPGKSPEQCAAIVAELLAASPGTPVVLTRGDAEQVAVTLAACPGGNPTGRPGRTDATGVTVTWRHRAPRAERIALLTAGTADLPVADECAAVLEAYGLDPLRIADVGVAGLHRTLDAAEDFVSADAVVVVAGMEGALASVVGGLTGAPVIAVPTSTGYGAGLAGVTALLGMLASCSAGISVVGIDNGFGAACAVLRLVGTRDRSRA